MSHHPQDRPDSMREADRPIVVEEEDARGGANANVRYVLMVSLIGSIIVLTLLYFAFFTRP